MDIWVNTLLQYRNNEYLLKLQINIWMKEKTKYVPDFYFRNIFLEETDKNKTSIENVEMGYGYGV